MAENTAESTSRTRAIQIVALVLLVGAAGYLAFIRGGSVEQLDTAETAATYVCVECGHGIDLTPAAYAKIITEARAARANTRETRGSSFLPCPKCGKAALGLGCKCPKDGTPVPQAGKDGKPGRCSKCGWVSFGG